MSNENVIILDKCEFEDSANCFWNAGHQGNGQGTSFIALDDGGFLAEGEGFTLEVVGHEVVDFDCVAGVKSVNFTQQLQGFDGANWYDLGFEAEVFVDEYKMSVEEFNDCPVEVVDAVETAIGESHVTGPVELANTGPVESMVGGLVIATVLVAVGLYFWFGGRK